MEWSNAQSLEFLEEYKNHAVLWDPKHSLYYSKNGKHDAWIEISKKLNVNTDDLKKKMLSLLGSFRREKARTKKSIRTGKGTNNRYVSKWFAYETMKFLADRHELKFTKSTENASYETDLDNNSKNSLDNIIGLPGSSSPNSDGSQTQHLSDDAFVGPSVKKSKNLRRSFRSDFQIDESFNILKYTNALTNSQFTLRHDECTSYGQYVENKIRNYSSKTRSIVQHQINNILFEADMGKFDKIE